MATKGVKFSDEHKNKLRGHNGRKKGCVPWNKGRPCDEKHKLLARKAHLGRHHTSETRKRISEKLRGNKTHLWKGGITPINRSIRNKIEYRLWRESVFSRDKWTCRWCGQVGRKLNAHHIKPFCDYPELRFAIDNGITLCKKCHNTIHTK